MQLLYVCVKDEPFAFSHTAQLNAIIILYQPKTESLKNLHMYKDNPLSF